MEGGEPGGGCWPMAGSSWYQLQPAQALALRITSSAPFDRTINVYRQNSAGLGGLSFVGCGYSFQSDLLVNLSGGSTYYVQVGRTPWTGLGSVSLTLAALAPPSNDAFSDAHSVGSLPYFEVVDMRGATVETAEPMPTGVGSFQGTAWWSFASTQSGPMLVGDAGCCANRNVGVYTGGALGSLVEVPVTRWSGRAIFQASADQTYYIQLGHNGVSGSQIGITLDVAPKPSVMEFHHPSDPSAYDTIGYFASAFDPAGFPVESFSWSFGDGGTAEGQSASHRYLADGSYSVTITMTMIDGRTASSTSIVVVKTHDVSITRLVAPQTAQAGRSKTITVEVKAARYDENVSVQLWRSVPGGFEPVGSSMQLVPARRQATPFVFSYTFRPEDQAIGKVTFKATASIVGARDALPADNEVVALPTKVS
jgi:PKD domain